jgi:hypothetical protein
MKFAEPTRLHRKSGIWGTPYCFARKDVGDPTGYLTLLLADYTSLDQPDLRKLLLNAIFWTAHLEVPKEGCSFQLPICNRHSHDSRREG